MKRLAAVAVLLLSTLLCGPSGRTESEATRHHEFDVTARRYAFSPALLAVHQHDTVRITLRSDDIPHSFVIEGYRIAKRVGAGETVTFDFVADRAGEFRFYCSLGLEDGCREMQGTLHVHP